MSQETSISERATSLPTPVGPVVQPGIPIRGAKERPVRKASGLRNRKVAGPNPARSTIPNLRSIRFKSLSRKLVISTCSLVDFRMTFSVIAEL